MKASTKIEMEENKCQMRCVHIPKTCSLCHRMKNFKSRLCRCHFWSYYELGAYLILWVWWEVPLVGTKFEFVTSLLILSYSVTATLICGGFKLLEKDFKKIPMAEKIKEYRKAFISGISRGLRCQDIQKGVKK